jgi:hypothetical protein
MSEPVVFISHFRVKEGKLADLRHLAAEVQRQLHDDKPRTVAYLMYLDDEGTEMTIVHTFPDAESMDIHFVGSDERSAAAFELLEPRGWEIYGRPNEGALETMRQAATSSGVSLIHRPDLLDGFLRLRSI